MRPDSMVTVKWLFWRRKTPGDISWIVTAGSAAEGLKEETESK